MKMVKRRIWSGQVCEQEIYYIADEQPIRKSKPEDTRFKDEDERRRFNDTRSRRNFIRLLNTNFDNRGYRIVFTFDNEHICYYYEDAYKLFRNFMRRLRRKFPEVKVLGEFGRGHSTARIHADMVMQADGLTPEIIQKLWKYGNCHIKSLRGQDLTALGEYIFKHYDVDERGEGNHRYYATRNLKKPEIEPAKECKRKYNEQHPPIAPKGYRFVEYSGGYYGYSCFKYIKKRE